LQLTDALAILMNWDRRGRYVFTKHDLAKLFDEQAQLLSKTLERLVEKDILIRAARGVYVFAHSAHRGAYTLEEVAQTLRRNSYNYLSLESALSEWGTISQIPIDRITVMTTGRRGEFKTPFGVIEFTHTEANPETILANTIVREPHPLRIAREDFAARNQRRTGRNVFLIEENR
jgi:predicted transcriptional regulator of viral defense system